MKNFWRIMTALTLTAVTLAGCGTAGNTGENAALQASTENETAMTPESEENETAEASAAEETVTSDPAGFTYLEEYQIMDFNGNGKEYALYAPKGGQNEEGLFYYNEHGVNFTAVVYSSDSVEELRKYLDNKVRQTTEFWQEDLECLDVSVGEVLEKEDDRYLILSAKDKDSLGTPYQKRLLKYMSVRDGNVGIFWDMQVREDLQDEETALLISEVARCYDLDLSEFGVENGTWAEQNAQRVADLRDVYEPEEGDPVLEKVEGYQYLGRLTMKLDDEGNVTYPVLAPMGWTTEAEENMVSAMLHGVYMQIAGGYTYGADDIPEILQKDADQEEKLRSDPELHNRNARVSEVMPLQGQEQGAFYTLTYESQDYGSEEYYKCAEITWLIRVKENYMVAFRVTLSSMDYDNNTNGLIKELETAYGFDLSEWYAKQ